MEHIRIERQKGYYGMIRSLEIIVDGARIGGIAQDESKVFLLPEGSRQIWGKMDWGETLRYGLSEYFGDQVLVFKASFTLNPLRNLGIMNLPFVVSVRDATDAEKEAIVVHSP